MSQESRRRAASQNRRSEAFYGKGPAGVGFEVLFEGDGFFSGY
jgi:hypothetical protein